MTPNRTWLRQKITSSEPSFFAREVAERMRERLDFIRLQPGTIIDLGSSHEDVELRQRYPHAHYSHLALNLPLLNAPQHAELVWSNLALNSLPNIDAVFHAVQRITKVGGLFMFSALGPDSFKELRRSFSDGFSHVNAFMDMHDYGDALLDAGFSDPVMDVDRITLNYAELNTLLADLRHAATRCTDPQYRRSLMGKTAWQTMQNSYAAQKQDNRFPVHLEVIFGHAWKEAPKKTEDGRAIIRFDRLD